MSKFCGLAGRQVLRKRLPSKAHKGAGIGFDAGKKSGLFDRTAPASVGAMWRIVGRTLSILAAGVLASQALAAGTTGRIVKVLPHYVDLQGRHTLSPSLFERDAYQALLRAHPDRQGGMRFDVRWKTRKASGQAPVLRLELVTAQHPKTRPLVIETPLPPGRRTGWTPIRIDRSTLLKAGNLIAWRVSLLEGDQPLHTRQSFLW